MRNIQTLLDIMARLRAPDGCPWDRKQTHESLKPFVLEEAYEVTAAIDQGDLPELKDELGDLLLQIVFQAQLASEAGHFDFGDVVAAISDKMIRRHPHVFGDEQEEAIDADGVLDRWEERKKSREGKGTFDGLPAALPALLKAYRVQEKAARLGFDWEDVRGPIGKVREETDELVEAIETHQSADQSVADAEAQRVEDELGDLLFSMVNVARSLDLNPEFALGRTTDRFVSRFKTMEAIADSEGLLLADMSLEEMDALWERAKKKLL
jgi:tetrapyrrole methylase family protein / MazG family protein